MSGSAKQAVTPSASSTSANPSAAPGVSPDGTQSAPGTFDLGAALAIVVESVKQAGALLREEFHREGGPRGASGTCPADAEAERILRDCIRTAFPAHAVIGEEIGAEDVIGSSPEGYVWLIDPNDGTKPYQAGFRGGAVSVGLLRDAVPVLGVVYAHTAPDDDGDLFTWAEGHPFRRNGAVITRRWPAKLEPGATVLVSHHADERPGMAAMIVHPARFRPMPSIAYRLALAAAGDGDIGISLNAPRAIDIAGGHALLIGAGADLYDEKGMPIRYTREGVGGGNCFGGLPWLRDDSDDDAPTLPAIAGQLASQITAQPANQSTNQSTNQSADPITTHPTNQSTTQRTNQTTSHSAGHSTTQTGDLRAGQKQGQRVGQDDPTQRLSRDVFAHLIPGHAVSDAGLLRRAQGCLLGQLAGDSLGSLVEFQSAREIRTRYPDGVRRLADGGTWNTIAGQPTDDSELALMLARSLVKQGKFDELDVLEAYVRWYRSHPFDIGNTTSTALGAASRAMEANEDALAAVREAASLSSQANGALMRVCPLALRGWNAPPDELAAWSRLDAALTHPHMVCQEASVVFTFAIATAVRDGISRRNVWSRTVSWAESRGVGKRAPSVMDALKDAEDGPPEDFQTHQGWVLVALRNAFFQLLHAPSLEEGVIDTVMQGGDTDTNAAIAGALLGAVHGREEVPRQWRDRVLTCRALASVGAQKPRPPVFWPIDAMTLAERLLG